jgi:hypothetical protein
MVTAQMGAIQNIRKSVERAVFPSSLVLSLSHLPAPFSTMMRGGRRCCYRYWRVLRCRCFCGDTVRYSISLDLAGNTVTNILHTVSKPSGRAEEIRKNMHLQSFQIYWMMRHSRSVLAARRKRIPRKILAQIIYERIMKFLLWWQDLRKPLEKSLEQVL